jgi:hypothetical protein
MMSDLGFIDPTYVPAITRVPMAARPSALQGKVIGMLDNTKEQADVIFKTIGDALIEKYGAKGVIVQRKEHYTKAATPIMLEAMAREVDVAITGLGG